MEGPRGAQIWLWGHYFPGAEGWEVVKGWGEMNTVDISFFKSWIDSRDKVKCLPMKKDKSEVYLFIWRTYQPHSPKLTETPYKQQKQIRNIKTISRNN